MRPRRSQPTVLSRILLLFIIIAALFFGARYAFEQTPWGQMLQRQLIEQVAPAEGEPVEIIEEEPLEAPAEEPQGTPSQEPQERTPQQEQPSDSRVQQAKPEPIEL